MHPHLIMILADERIAEMHRSAERARRARKVRGRSKQRFGFRPSLALRVRRARADMRAAQ